MRPQPMAIAHVHLGGPVWSCPHWVGSLYPPGARAPSFLHHYAQVWNAVEGNSTFYALPAAETFARWREATPPGFRFCLKAPRTVTHDRMLVGAERPFAEFLANSAVLGDRLGPTMIQLPPTFGPQRLDALVRFVDALPDDRRFAVEPRHPAWVGEGTAARALDDVLRARGIDRVLFDASVLHAATDDDAAIREAQRRKPRLPAPAVATADHPVIRLVGVGAVAAWHGCFARWAVRVAAWIGAGRQPTVFVHTADDRDVPTLCAAFHAVLARHVDVGDIPPWPGGGEHRQISLFDP